MIAAARRRIAAALSVAAKRTRQVDRALARRIERLRPVLVRRLVQAWAVARRGARTVGRRLRPLAIAVLRLFSRAERLLRRAAGLAARWATRASAAITPARAIAAAILAAAVCLAVSQFVTYSSVEISGGAYAGLPAAAPRLGGETAGEAHAYVMIPIAVLAAAAALLGMRSERRGLGRVVFGLGLLALAVTLLVDLPAGRDAGAATSSFASAEAVLEAGFYGQLAAAAGLLLGGLLYYARPCRIRINLSGRAASARRRRRRRQDSSRRKAARRPSPPRSAAASAPVSRR
jgi:hypothetical protein